MATTVDTVQVFTQPWRMPAGAAAGRIAVSDATGNVSWQPDSTTIVKAVADTTNATTTAKDVAGLGLTVAANQVVTFRFTLVVAQTATTGGIQLGLNGPATPTALTARIVVPASTTTDATLYVNAYETFSAGTASPGTTRAVAVIEGVLRNGATAGTFIPRLRSSSILSTASVLTGSTGVFT